MTTILYSPHSPAFAAAWRETVGEIFGYRVEGGFLRVPGLMGRPVLSYLPLLNYSDLGPDDANRLAESAGRENYLIRVLDPDSTELQPDEPVALRVDLSAGNPDAVWAQCLRSRARNRVRKAQGNGLVARKGVDRALLRDFYRIYLGTMHRHGAPALPRRLFEALGSAMGAELVVVYRGPDPVAGLVMVADGGLCWVPYIATSAAAWDLYPSHLLYWECMRSAVAGGAYVLDFGRSRHAGSNYQFKRQWGATPVRIRLLRPGNTDVYAKYRLAQALWSRLPRSLVDRLGPRLARYLADY